MDVFLCFCFCRRCCFWTYRLFITSRRPNFRLSRVWHCFRYFYWYYRSSRRSPLICYSSREIFRSMAASNSSSSSSVPSLPPPCPKSPLQYPDVYGKRRERLKVQRLEREIGFLEVSLTPRYIDCFYWFFCCCGSAFYGSIGRTFLESALVFDLVDFLKLHRNHGNWPMEVTDRLHHSELKNNSESNFRSYFIKIIFFIVKSERDF